MTKRRFARRPEGYRCTRLSLRLLGLPMGLAARRPGMADLSGKGYEDKWPGLFAIAGSEEAARPPAGIKVRWLPLLVALLILSACRVGPPKRSPAPVETAVPMPTSTSPSRTTEIDLPFETIEQRDASGVGKVYEDKRPGLLIIARPEETAGLKSLVRPEAQARLQGLDYDHYFAVVVFQGWKTTNRYGVQIERIARWGSEVTIYARFSEPDPNKERGPEITSPYHLVQVKKVGRWEQEIAFQVVVDGINVTSLSHYVP